MTWQEAAMTAAKPAALALVCAGACIVQMLRPGWRFLVSGLVAFLIFWILGLGAYPALALDVLLDAAALLRDAHHDSSRALAGWLSQ